MRMWKYIQGKYRISKENRQIKQLFKAEEVYIATRLGEHNTLAIPALMYGSEIWTLKKQNIHRMTTTEVKFSGDP